MSQQYLRVAITLIVVVSAAGEISGKAHLVADQYKGRYDDPEYQKEIREELSWGRPDRESKEVAERRLAMSRYRAPSIVERIQKLARERLRNELENRFGKGRKTKSDKYALRVRGWTTFTFDVSYFSHSKEMSSGEESRDVREAFRRRMEQEFRAWLQRLRKNPKIHRAVHADVGHGATYGEVDEVRFEIDRILETLKVEAEFEKLRIVFHFRVRDLDDLTAMRFETLTFYYMLWLEAAVQMADYIEKAEQLKMKAAERMAFNRRRGLPERHQAESLERAANELLATVTDWKAQGIEPEQEDFRYLILESAYRSFELQVVENGFLPPDE